MAVDDDVRKYEDIFRGPRNNYLSFLQLSHLEIGSTEDRVWELEEHCTSCDVWCALGGP